MLGIRFLRRTSLIGYLFLAGCLAVSGVENYAHSGRVVAVGDVHGNFEGFTEILRKTALIDKETRWIGKDAVLVQTGDILDRGRDAKRLMDLLMRLASEAEQSGGKVIVLLGNHEMMNITRHFRDVPKKAIEAFSPPDSDPGAETAGYKEALGPNGIYGKWLRSLEVAVVVGDTLFLHGGISPEMRRQSVKNLNETAKQEVAFYDEQWAYLESNGFITAQTTLGSLRTDFEAALAKNMKNTKKARGRQAMAKLAGLMNEGILFREDGPLWFRGFDTFDDNGLLAYLPKYLERQKVGRIVSGHSPQNQGTVRMRLKKQLFLIDTGMQNEVYKGGRGSALEIEQGRVVAIYPDHKQTLVASLTYQANRKAPAHGNNDRLWLGPDGTPLPFTSNREAVEFLREAMVVDETKIPVGVTKPVKVLLEKDGIQAHGVFRYFHRAEGKGSQSDPRNPRNFRDSFTSEVAAYELNLLLGMGTIPPTVRRTIDGALGSLQLWVENTMTDGDRIRKKVNPPSIPHWDRQFWDLRVFDNLVNNSDRNHGNVLIDEEWRIWLIDHTRTFAKDITLPNPQEITRVSKSLWSALNALDKAEVRKKLRPHLDSDEIAALFSRHRKLLVYLNQKMDKMGKENVLFNHRHCCGS